MIKFSENTTGVANVDDSSVNYSDGDYIMVIITMLSVYI